MIAKLLCTKFHNVCTDSFKLIFYNLQTVTSRLTQHETHFLQFIFTCILTYVYFHLYCIHFCAPVLYFSISHKSVNNSYLCAVSRIMIIIFKISFQNLYFLSLFLFYLASFYLYIINLGKQLPNFGFIKNHVVVMGNFVN